MLGRAGIYYALSTPQMERATELHLLGKLPLLGPLFILNNLKVKKNSFRHPDFYYACNAGYASACMHTDLQQ